MAFPTAPGAPNRQGRLGVFRLWVGALWHQDTHRNAPSVAGCALGTRLCKRDAAGALGVSFWAAFSANLNRSSLLFVSWHEVCQLQLIHSADPYATSLAYAFRHMAYCEHNLVQQQRPHRLDAAFA
jgi:hypothetical protein